MIQPKPTTHKEYFIPEKHIQLGIIANTPHWLRVYFMNEGRKQLVDEINQKKFCVRCFYSLPHDTTFSKKVKTIHTYAVMFKDIKLEKL